MTLLVTGLLSVQVCHAQTIADKIFFNAKVYTANDNQPFAEAIAVKGDTILFVGSDSDVMAYKGTGTVEYNVQGGLILPGFHDVHSHPLEAGSPIGGGCLLDGQETDPENLGVELDNCNPQANSNGWIFASGHSIYTLLDALRPPYEILDDYFPNTPVCVMEETSHSVWVNSKALQMAGINSTTPDPVGGHILREINGDPTGILMDNAGDAVLSLALASSAVVDTANYNGLINYGLPQLAQHGITSVCEGRTYWKRNFHHIWNRIKNEGKLTARVVLGLWAYPDDTDASLLPALQGLYDAGDDMLRATQIKVYSDGITINATAAFHDPYNDNLGLPFNSGLNYFTAARLETFITSLEQIGFDFHIHAIGDRGITESLNAIAGARTANGALGARHRITHLEVVRTTDYPRFAQLDVIADMQVAGEFTQPANWQDNAPLIGATRSDNLIPLKSIFDAGAHVTLSSDWDVSDLNPFVGIQNALTRAPQNLPSVEDAVKAYTIKGAFVMRQEDRTGSIESGKYADLIFADQDIFTVPTTQISNTKICLTLLGGEEVFRNSCAPVSASAPQPEQNLRFEAYPNPSHGSFTLKWTGNIPQSYQVNIFDVRGNRVREMEHRHGANRSSMVLDLRKLPEGLYTIQTKASQTGESSTSKVVVYR